MANRTRHDTRGFTVMELVVVIAIIGVLVGISAPFFGQQVDNARRSHDIACVEDAVAAAKAEYAYDYDPEHPEDKPIIYTFDAATGIAERSEGSISGYGQWNQKADYTVEGIKVGGVAKDSFVTCGIKAGKITTLHWGSHYTWASVVPDLGSSSGNNWNENAKLRESVLAIDNDQRIQVDQSTVKAFREFFIGKTSNELKEILKGKYDNAVGKDGGLLFFYRIDSNSNSIRIGYPAPGTGYLEAIGYPTTTISGQPIQDIQSNYMSQYLFVSDDMIRNGVELVISLKITLKDGVAEDCRIFVYEYQSNPRVYIDYLDTDKID